MQPKFNKILDRALELSAPPLRHDPDAEWHIHGYPVGDILDSATIQDKLYELFFPASIKTADIRTMGLEDIRSRR